MNRWAILLLVVLLIPLSVSAVTVERLKLTNCGFASTSEVACDQTNTVYCYVNSTVNDAQGAAQVNSVTFTVGGYDYDGVLTSGTRFGGLWEADVTVEPTFAQNPMYLDYVEAVASNGVVCAAVGGSGVVYEDESTPECYVAFSTNNSFSTDCACTYTLVSDSCASDNTRTVVKSPSAGCGTLSNVVSTSVCDYCDPQWIVDDVTCYMNRSQSIAAYNDPLVGVGSVSLTSQNPSCCATTGLVSDCAAPVVSSSALCSLDAWAGGYNLVTGAMAVEANTKGMTNVTFKEETAVSTEQFAGRSLQPVSFDFDNDGRMENVVLGDAGNIYVYSGDGGSLERTISTGYDGFVGEPALTGFSLRASDDNVNSVYWDATSDWLNGGYAGFAVIAQDSGVNRFLSYRYNGTGYSALADVSIATTGGNAMSVMCERDVCWTVRDGDTLMEFSATSGAVSTISLSGATGVDSALWRNVPVKRENLVFVKGWNAGDGVESVYACNVDTDSCSVAVDTRGGVGNVSQLVVLPKTDDGEYPVSFWEKFTDTNNDTLAFVVTVYFVNGSTPSVGTAFASELSSSGSVPGCMSQPAGARCAGVGGDGVAFSTAWVTQTVLQTLIGISDVDDDLHYESGSTELIGLTDTSYNTPGDISASSCFNGVCFAVEARGEYVESSNSSLTATPQDFYVNDGSGWVGTSAHPGFNGPYQLNTSCWSRDAVVAIGALSEGDFLVVLGSVTKGPLGCGGATIVPSFGNFTVWKYDVASDSWSQLGSKITGFESHAVSSYDSSNVIIENMKCGETYGCYMFSKNHGMYNSVGQWPTYYIAPWVLEISVSGVLSTFSPSGAPIGGVEIASNKTAIVDYYRSGSTRYVALTTFWDESAETSRQAALLRYNSGSSTSYTLLEYSSIDDTHYYGLMNDGSDVKWVKSPNLAYQSGPNRLCAYNTTRYSNGRQAPIFRSAVQTVDNFYATGTDANANDIMVCTVLVRKDSNMNSVAATTVVSHEYETFGGAMAADHVLQREAHPYALPGIDNDGSYYVIAAWPYCILDGNTTESQCLVDDIYAPTVISEGSVFIAEFEEYASGVFAQAGREDGVVCPASEASRVGVNDWVTCHPDSISHGSTATTDSQSLGLADEGPGAALKIMHGFDIGDGRTKHINGLFAGTLYYNFLGSGGSSTVTSGEYTEYSCYVPSVGFGDMRRVSTGTQTGTICNDRVVAVDANIDGVDELATYRGVYETTGTDRMFAFSGSDNTAGLAVADLNGDTWTDAFFISNGLIRSYVSSAQFGVSFASNLSMQSLECSVDGSVITAVPTGIGSVHPESLSYAATLFQNATNYTTEKRVDSFSSTDTYVATLSASRSGAHTVVYTITDRVNSQTTTNRCSVNVDIPAQVITLPNETLGCGLGNDGEFSWSGEITQGTNWMPGCIDCLNPLSEYNPVAVSDGYAKFRSVTNVLHGLDCVDTEFKVEMSLKVSDSSDFSVGVQAVDTFYSETIGLFQVIDGYLYVYNAGAPTLADPVSLADDEYHTITMEFNREESTYQVLIDDEPVSGNPFSLVSGSFTGKYVDVFIKHLRGSVDVDYVRTLGLSSGEGDVTSPVAEQEQNAIDVGLALCADGSDRDFSAQPAGTIFYENVERYCDELPIVSGQNTGAEVVNGKKICTFEGLRKAVTYNGRCYKEAFDYCLYETYPRTGALGTLMSGDDPLEPVGGGMDGAAVCNTALGASVSYGGFLTPFFKVVWSIFTANALVTLIIIFALVAVGVLSKSRRQ